MYVLNSEMENGILLPLTATTRYGAITERAANGNHLLLFLGA